VQASSTTENQKTGTAPDQNQAGHFKKQREALEKETKRLVELLSEKRKLQVAQAREDAIKRQLGLGVQESQPGTESMQAVPSDGETRYCKFDNDDERKFIRVRRAVMAPKEASDAFGRRIGKRFIVFQVTVENNDKDYQYMIHDISVDLSR